MAGDDEQSDGPSASEWTPSIRADLDWTGLDLDAEEGFVLSRIDGHSKVRDLANVTGMPPERISSILAKLDTQGALVEPAPATAPPAAVDLGAAAPAGVQVEHMQELEAGDLDEDLFEDGLLDDTDEGDAIPDGPEKGPDDESANASEDEAAGVDDDGDDDDGDDDERAESDYRKRYVEVFRSLDSDERVKIAQTARGSNLCALCFDPDHRVIMAILENGQVTQKQGRLIAKHHRTSTGLDRLGRVTVMLRDRTTQRFLVRNPQMSDALFRKMMQPKRMLESFHMTTNREATEKVRRVARKVFRTKFQGGTPEERVQLLLTTEGRCLPQLIGLSLDGRTSALLCGRTIQSTLFVQNLSRWPGVPPQVLAHLARSPIVKRMPQLRALIRQHPNCPAILKKQLL